MKIFNNIFAYMSKYLEDTLSIAFATYLRLKHKDLLFAHIANERQTSIARGAKLKKMGVKAGMPDYLIFKQNKKGNLGLAIELKIKPRKLSQNQVATSNMFIENEWRFSVCYDIQGCIETLEEYLK